MTPENFLLISNQNINDFIDGSLLGYYFTKDTLAFGTKGLHEHQRLDKNFSIEEVKEGRFIAILKDRNELVIKTDNTGQEIIYLFKKDDNWMISNSFLYLAQSAAKRHKLSIYEPSIYGFFLKNGVHIGEQLLSHRTMIDEITIIPTHHEVRINILNKKLHIIENDIYKEPLFDPKDYTELLTQTLEIGAGLLASLADTGCPLNLFLSGGYDSRLILAMLLAGTNNNLPENLFVTSHESKPDDFKSASNLADKLGLKLNKFEAPKKTSSISSSDAFRQYLTSCGGTYLPIYPVSDMKQSKDVYIRLTGDQPTGWSHFAGSAPFNGSASKIASDIETSLKKRGMGELVRNEFLTTFDTLNVDPQDPYAMLIHYSAIRSRHHCGRNSYKSLGNVALFTPLMQSKFIDLELKNSAKGNHPKQFFCDAFLNFPDWAISEPFETKERGFEQKLIDASHFKNTPKLSPVSFSVLGHPSEMFETNSEPSIFDYPIKMNVDHNQIKDLIHTAFYTAGLARESGIFTEEDFAFGNKELKERGSLSHSYRKSTHIIVTDVVLSIVESSRKNQP